ncbi:MAG: hypothetical protein RLY86_828 [Pseudomonadota bacterium]|jgi:predicted alpha-1,2-mannosidase
MKAGLAAAVLMFLAAAIPAGAARGAAGGAAADPTAPGIALAAGGTARTGSVTDHVDPFIGTDGTGHVFPGASVPFGMVAPSPDNADRGWSYTSGYQYRAPRILGFSNTHISGAGINELGDVLLQPVAGTPWTAATTDFAAAYDKGSEAARPGYYAVTLPDHGVRVELTATQRVAIQRYSFDRTGPVQVLVDLQHGLHFTADHRVTDASVTADPATGEITGTVHSANWVVREASFIVRFDRVPQRIEELPRRPGEKAPRYLLTFDTGSSTGHGPGPGPGRTLEARIALSTVDVEGARRNLAEAAGRDFDRIRNDADALWADHLSRIEITADPRRTEIFYSSLYRTLLHPSNIADIDGRVRGARGQVIQAEGAEYYSTLSLWDTFRGVHPLHTLIVPERVPGYIRTLTAHADQQGYLPLWTAWGRETWTMIGNPAMPVIADAVAKGFTGFDRQAALAAMIRTATLPRPDALPSAHRSWDLHEQFGYIPYDLDPHEPVSRVLEDQIGDAALAAVARTLGDTAMADRLAARAARYPLLFDPETRTMRGRDSKGSWRAPFDPVMATSPLNNPGDYTEANAYQYTLTPALHDPRGLVDLMGGPVAFEAWLDHFFTLPKPNPDKFLGQEAMIGQYAHGNEPSHHIAYLYAFTPNPGKGHRLIRRILTEFYGDGPDGIIGNDDCGQMGAWYVLSTLGFYPVVPGSGTFTLGAPQVEAAVIRTGGGRSLRIQAPGAGADRPVALAATLDGAPLDPRAMPFAGLAAGGDLHVTLGAGP